MSYNVRLSARVQDISIYTVFNVVGEMGLNFSFMGHFYLCYILELTFMSEVLYSE